MILTIFNGIDFNFFRRSYSRNCSKSSCLPLWIVSRSCWRKTTAEAVSLSATRWVFFPWKRKCFPARTGLFSGLFYGLCVWVKSWRSEQCDWQDLWKESCMLYDVHRYYTIFPWLVHANAMWLNDSKSQTWNSRFTIPDSPARCLPQC